jgi:hypothetical protein
LVKHLFGTSGTAARQEVDFNTYIKDQTVVANMGIYRPRNPHVGGDQSWTAVDRRQHS